MGPGQLRRYGVLWMDKVRILSGLGSQRLGMHILAFSNDRNFRRRYYDIPLADELATKGAPYGSLQRYAS